MNEIDCLKLMKAPGDRRLESKHYGVIQILLTRSCQLSCYNCTQGSNLGGKTSFMTLENFGKACMSLKGYPGTVGIFGGNPCLHPQFGKVCKILREHHLQESCGLWSNDIMEWGEECRKTFNPSRSNLNAHLVSSAYQNMKNIWPESHPFGLNQDSRHAPAGFVSMTDLDKLPNGDNTEENRLDLISRCSINQRWSAGMAEFRGELRGYFCEIAMSQAQLHQFKSDYPDTGIDIVGEEFVGDKPTGGILTFKAGTTDPNRHETIQWWQLPMFSFRDQVREHCHHCSVPLNGYGELSQQDDDVGVEQASKYHGAIYKPKRSKRKIEIVERLEQIGVGKINRVIDYLKNSKV